MRITDAILRAEATKDVLTDIGDGNYEVKGCEPTILNNDWSLHPHGDYYELNWGKRSFRIDEEYMMVLLDRICCEEDA